MSENKEEHNPDISFTIGKVKSDVSVLQELRKIDRRDIDTLREAVLDPKTGLVVQVESIRKGIKAVWIVLALVAGVIGPVITTYLIKCLG